MSIPESTIEEIRSRVSIVEIASEFCDVKRSGSKHLACCPFHQEKTPSCSFNEEEGFFYCFGCGKKGNVYTLLMELRGMSFPDAVRSLGERVGIAVRDDSQNSHRASNQVSEKVILREVVAAAARAYILTLRSEESGRSARDYFSQRGLSELTQKRYCLGYAPAHWEFIEERTKSILESGTFSGKLEAVPQYLRALGLIKQRTSESEEARSGYYDAFRDRVIFPILRNDNTPVAFGARLLKDGDGKQPKYLNSSESALYQKRKILYGLGPALNDIRSRRHLYLVEGYMDVLSLVDAGVPNVLATCGTAVSEDHARAISRFADRVTLVFDGDLAGKKAAARCFEAFLNTGVEVSVRSLPDGEDPDTIARSYSSSSVVEYLSREQSGVLCLYLSQLKTDIGGEHEISSAALMGKVAERCSQTLAKVRNPVERDMYVQEAAEFLGISASSLASIVQNQQQRAVNAQRSNSYASSSNKNYSLSNTKQSYTLSSAQNFSSDYTEHSPPVDSYSFESAEAEEETEQKNSNNFSRSNERFHHELIVAILSEPLLAPTVLEIPSLIGSEQEGENSALPENILKFLEHVAEKGLPVKVPDECIDQEGRAKIHALLQEFSIKPTAILDELLRQFDVGGGNPTRVLSQAAKIARRQGLLNQMVQIRGEEERSTEIDAAERLRLAQSKLEKRKALERVSAEEND